jgi:hypothetical protein
MNWDGICGEENQESGRITPGCCDEEDGISCFGVSGEISRRIAKGDQVHHEINQNDISDRFQRIFRYVYKFRFVLHDRP